MARKAPQRTKARTNDPKYGTLVATRLKPRQLHRLDGIQLAHGLNTRAEALRYAIDVAFEERPRR